LNPTEEQRREKSPATAVEGRDIDMKRRKEAVGVANVAKRPGYPSIRRKNKSEEERRSTSILLSSHLLPIE
jgi:hypothetical protein